jgi:hypothetical protein
MKLYIFKGKKVKARSKDEVIRKAGLPVNKKNYLLVTKINKRGN